MLAMVKFSPRGCASVDLRKLYLISNLDTRKSFFYLKGMAWICNLINACWYLLTELILRGNFSNENHRCIGIFVGFMLSFWICKYTRSIIIISFIYFLCLGLLIAVIIFFSKIPNILY